MDVGAGLASKMTAVGRQATGISNRRRIADAELDLKDGRRAVLMMRNKRCNGREME